MSSILGLPLPPGGQRGFWYMMLAIIKYKRLQKLFWERIVIHAKATVTGMSKADEEVGDDLEKRTISLKYQVEHLLGKAEAVSSNYLRRDQFYLPWKMCHSYTTVLSGFVQRYLHFSIAQASKYFAEVLEGARDFPGYGWH